MKVCVLLLLGSRNMSRFRCICSRLRTYRGYIVCCYVLFWLSSGQQDLEIPTFMYCLGHAPGPAFMVAASTHIGALTPIWTELLELLPTFMYCCLGHASCLIAGGSHSRPI